MLPVLTVAAFAVCGWAIWLAASRGVPGWLRALPPCVAVGTIVLFAIVVGQIYDAFELTRDVNPAERQHMLSQRIANAYSTLLVGGVIAIVAIAVLTMVVKRRQRAMTRE